MTDRIPIGYRLSVSRANDGSGKPALILWERLAHTDEIVALGTISHRSGHVVDAEALTVTPSIVAGTWHGFLTNGEWRDA